MKKLLLLYLLASACLSARADVNSSEVLSKMDRAISSYSAYEVRFTASLEDEFYDIEGRFIVSGNKYFLDVYDSQVFYDGKVRYTFSDDDNEVILETPDPADKSILSDPTSIFDLYDSDYTHSFLGEETINGRTFEVITLSPKAPNGVFESLVLSVDKGSSLPGAIQYILSGMGKEMEINVISVNPDVTITADTFTFDSSKYPGVEIIDFR